MKNLLFAALLFLGASTVKAQVFSGIQEVEKASKEGLYTSVAVDEKYVKESWAKELAKYGKIETGKGGAYKILSATIPTISPDPVNLVSRVFSDNGRTKIFLSLALGEENIVNGSHPKYAEGERILTTFVNTVTLEENVRTEQKKLESFQDVQKRIARNSDKLVRSIENNKKEKENLLKKIEENRIELEKLLTDVEQIKKDQVKAGDEVNLQLKRLDEAKKIVPTR
ncbi:MAG: hypothetical protein QE277_04155 [Flectobacillus sp.]|nr:hypothetical protein [Flectobacillus sp.]